MMLTPDEYMAIMRLLESSRESEGASLALRSMDDTSASPPSAEKQKKKRKASKYGRELGRQWKIVKERSRKMNGDFRSGWNRTKELKAAHKATKKIV